MDFLSITVILLVVLDPFGNLPLFSSVISTFEPKDQKRILIRESLIALVIILLFLFLGQYLLNFLGLETSTLSISGGVILFLIALGMLFPSKSVLSGPNDDIDEEPFIVPLAIPLVAGPSVLTYVMLLSKQYEDQTPMVAAATVTAWAISAFILMLSPLFMKWLGKKGMRALERLMGMILILISVQMFLNGLTNYLNINNT